MVKSSDQVGVKVAGTVVSALYLIAIIIKKWSDKKMCLKTCENGCESSYIFKIEYNDGAIEHFCNECLSNVIREVPEIIVKVEAI